MYVIKNCSLSWVPGSL